MSDQRTAEEWCEDVRGKIGDYHDADLVKRLALEILDRWRREAGKMEDPALGFREMYLNNKVKAQGAIVAIVELVQAVGQGKALPKTFEGLLN